MTIVIGEHVYIYNVGIYDMINIAFWRLRCQRDNNIKRIYLHLNDLYVKIKKT